MNTNPAIRDVMSRTVHCLSPEQSLESAAESLGRWSVSGAPVCDADGRVIGVVSRGDLTEAWLRAAAGVHARLEAVMSRDVVTATPNDSVQTVAERMVFEGVHRIVIVDASGAPLGIVTPLDVLRAVVAAGPLSARPLDANAPAFPAWPARPRE